MAQLETCFSALVFAILATLTATMPAPESPPVYGVPSLEVASSPLQYSYAYDIQDPISGVFTSKTETRDGNAVVHGSYTIDDPDGFRRTVQYTADPVHGFNAEVRRESGAVVPQVSYAVPAIPVPLPVVQTYVASPPPLPPPALVPQVVSVPPVAVPLAPVPAPVWRTSAPGIEPGRFRTSVSSPTYSFAY